VKELSRINKYLIKYKGLLFLGILFTVISNIFVIIPAQLVRIAIDYVAESYALFAPLTKGGIGELAREYFLESVFVFWDFDFSHGPASGLLPVFDPPNAHHHVEKN